MGLRERREREKLARKQAILEAARSLLFEKGLAGTSVPQIANRAELAVGTIYTYYSSKEEIFAGLQEEGLAILYAKITEACQRLDSAPEKLRAVAKALKLFTNEQKDYFEVVNYFLSTPQILLCNELKRQVDQQGKKILKSIEEIIRQGIKEGSLFSDDPEKDASVFLGMLYGMLQFKKLQATVLESMPFEEIYSHGVERLLLAFKALSTARKEIV